MGAAVVDIKTPVLAGIPGLSVSGLARPGSWSHSAPGSHCDEPAGQGSMGHWERFTNWGWFWGVGRWIWTVLPSGI